MNHPPSSPHQALAATAHPLAFALPAAREAYETVTAHAPAAAAPGATTTATPPPVDDPTGGMLGFEGGPGGEASSTNTDADVDTDTDTDTPPTEFAPGAMDGMEGMDGFGGFDDEVVDGGDEVSDTPPTQFAPGYMDGMGGMDGFEDNPGDSALSPAATDPILEYILGQKNQVIPHHCYVAVTPDPRDVSEKPLNIPIVWCDFRVLPFVNVTAEIRDGGCDEFVEPASSEIYTRGVAQPIFMPVITEEEKRGGIIAHSYCARVDYLYDAGGTGDHSRSVLDQRFPMSITYRYKETVDENGQIVEEALEDVTLTDDNTTGEEMEFGVILGLGFLAGAIFCVALIAIFFGEKKKKKQQQKQRVQQMMEDGAVDVEITPIAAPPREENEII